MAIDIIRRKLSWLDNILHIFYISYILLDESNGKKAVEWISFGVTAILLENKGHYTEYRRNKNKNYDYVNKKLQVKVSLISNILLSFWWHFLLSKIFSHLVSPLIRCLDLGLPAKTTPGSSWNQALTLLLVSSCKGSILSCARCGPGSKG